MFTNEPPPAIERKMPPLPAEEESVLARVRDAVRGQPDSPAVERLRAQTQAQLVLGDDSPFSFSSWFGPSYL